jgi:molybdopterin converting factor small subunit
MHNITVNLFYHLKDKAGTNKVVLDIPDTATVKELKRLLITKFPALESHLDNILILINQKIALDEDIIPKESQVSFLTPIGGG